MQANRIININRVSVFVNDTKIIYYALCVLSQLPDR